MNIQNRLSEIKRKILNINKADGYENTKIIRLTRDKSIPIGGKTETFDQPDALRINKARMEHLDSLGFDFKGKSVIDLGCGVGHLAQFFLKKKCKIVCLDGRKENINELKKRYPGIKAYTSDVESENLTRYGRFDIVFCYGLLYHLENPIRFLRNIFPICKDLLLLETVVCDSEIPLLRIEDETYTFSQALQGIGTRPSPLFVTYALNRIGFEYVYTTKSIPEFEDFKYDKLNNMDYRRDGHLLRKIFIASKKEIVNENIVDLVK